MTSRRGSATSPIGRVKIAPATSARAGLRRNGIGLDASRARPGLFPPSLASPAALADTAANVRRQ
jgi:hypothetical protein